MMSCEHHVIQRQEIVQNAEVMGRSLRSIALRIRGYSEESEDGALEMDESLKTIQGDLIDLTKTAQHPLGVSVFKEGSTTEFKSLVDYLGEISDIWDEMSQKQQNDFLQKAFAKTQAQSGAAIIKNFDQVRKALEEMENAAGSADAEMEIIRDSVAFKLNELKQTWIGYAQELLQRDDIGKIIDALINGSEKLEGTLDTLAPVIEYTIKLIAEIIESIGNIVGVTGKATPWIIAFLVAFKKREGILSLLKDLKQFKNFVVDFPKNAKTFILTLQTIYKMMKGMDVSDIKYGLTMKSLSGNVAAEEIEGIVTSATGATEAIGMLTAAWPALIAAIILGGFAIYDWWNSCEQVVKRTDKAIDKLFELRDTFQKEADAARESAKNLEELNKRYQEAVKGSSEYYDIANQIADLEPSLVIGFTSTGDAILATNGAILEQIQYYKDLADAKREAAKEENEEIINEYNKEGSDLNTYQRKLEETKAKIESYNAEIEAMKDPEMGESYAMEHYNNNAKNQIEAHKALRDEAIKDLEIYTQKAIEVETKVRSAYASLLPTADDISDAEKLMRGIVIDIGVSTKMDADSFNVLYEKAKKVGDKIFKELFDLQGNKKLSTAEYQKQAEELFNELVEALHLENDENGQLALRVSLKIDSVSVANARQEAVNWAKDQGLTTTKYDGSELVTTANEDVVQWYQTLNEEELKVANSDAFRTELEKQEEQFGKTAEACRKAYYAVKDYVEVDENGHKSLKNALEGYKVDENTTGQDKLDEYYDTISRVQEVINKINTGDYTAMDLNQWRAEYDLVGESADDMVKELKDVEKESRETVIELIDKLIEANPDDTELIKSLKLIKEGIKEVHEEAEKKMNFDPGVDKLSQFSSALDSLKDSYIGLFKDGDQIDASSLMSIREVFGELGDDYADFEKAVLSGSDDIDGAFDKLVSAYAHQKNILSEVNEENKQYYITLLKDKGVVNAEEVVASALNNKLEIQKFKMDALSASSKDLQNKTSKNSQGFLEEANMSNFAKVQLADLVAKEKIFNNQSLDVSQKIGALKNLARAYFGASAAAEFLDSVDRGYDTSNQKYRKNPEEAWEDLWNKQLKSVETPKIDFDFDATKAKDAAGSGSEQTAETFDWIDTKIQRLERDITNLGKTADATFKTWSERTVALGQEIGKVNEQIKLQETAYNSYMAKAESVGLSAQYKALVQNGGLKIDEITDDKLKEQIQSYQEWYEKALDAKDKIDDLRSSLAELAKTKFDNISTQFEDLLSDIEHINKYIDAQLKSVETMGKIAGKSFYEAQIEQQRQQANDLNAELAQLQIALNEGLASGAIEYGSQMFNEMKKTIYGVEEQIWDCNTAILEFEQNIKQVAKQNFDDLKSQFESAIGILTDKIDLTDKIVSMVQATGHIASRKYYESMAEGTEQNIKNLKKKYETLNDAFNEAVSNGDIKEYSDDWYLNMPHYLVISIANLFNCWNSLKLIGLQRKDETNLSVTVVKTEKIYQMMYG